MARRYELPDVSSNPNPGYTNFLHTLQGMAAERYPRRLKTQM